MPVLFVRELTAAGDLILAFGDDGRPVWALDRETGLQWWYSGEQAEVRAAIAEAWESFATMPITAASYAGPHPAWELHRRDGRPVVVPERDDEHPVRPWLRRRRAWFLRLSPPARILVVAGSVVLLFALVPWVLGGLFPAPPRPAVVDPVGSVVPAEGQRCTVRGELADDAEGHQFVCAASSRALSSDLIWRPIG
ncbi:MAG: hypothetical protein U0S36_01490 [Candidatus Nanopelagicales bacterium]